MKNTPRFIAIEGLDGAGKSTLANAIELCFTEKGLDILLTQEPTGGQVGHRVQRILDGKMPLPGTNRELQRLRIEDRFDHIRSIIKPHLQLGNWVLTVNYWLLTLADGMSEGKVEDYERMNDEIIGEHMIYPHIALLLDAPADVCLERLERKGIRFVDWSEKKVLEKIRANYMWLAENGRFGNICVINADRPKDEVLSSAITALGPFL